MFTVAQTLRPEREWQAGKSGATSGQRGGCKKVALSAICGLVSALMVMLTPALLFAGAPLPVFVSIAPQKFFVQQIGGDRVAVQVMVPPGASPATYEPKPRQMAALSRAKVYFAVGVPFEHVWLNKIAAAGPGMTVVATDQGIEKRAMTSDHHHESTADHDEGLDPHIWLSPPLVKIQARTILAALQQADPPQAQIYQTNCDRFVSRLDALDTELRTALAGKQGRRFMVFHPSWGYFAQAYGLEQVPVEVEGKDPKPGQLAELIEAARRQGIGVIFVQPQFSSKSARLIASAIGGQVAVADPLAEDWEANLRRVAQQLKRAVR